MTGGDSLHGLLQTDAPIAATSSGGRAGRHTGSVIGIVTAFAATSPTTPTASASPPRSTSPTASRCSSSSEGTATPRLARRGGRGPHPDQAASMGLSGGATVRGRPPGRPRRQGRARRRRRHHRGRRPQVESMPGLAVEIRDHEPGDEVEVGYLRDGEHRTADVTVEERPVRYHDQHDAASDGGAGEGRALALAAAAADQRDHADRRTQQHDAARRRGRALGGASG